MQLVTVFTAFSPMDAQVVRSRLEAAEFHPVIANELAALSTEGYSLSVGGIQVQVPDNEVEEARLFLAPDSAPPDETPET